MTTKQTKTAPRIRNDTFWNHTDDENADFFQSIYDETSSTYRLVVGATKKDYKGRERECWRVISKTTGNPADSMRSTKSYRLSVIWAIKKKFYVRERKRKLLEQNYKSAFGKRGDHNRHRCGHDWCCNPGHITISLRTENEVDKHYHYFLNHSDESVRDRFKCAFPDLMRIQGVW